MGSIMQALEPRTIRSGRQGPAIVATAMLFAVAAIVVMILLLVIYQTGWRSQDPYLWTLLGIVVLLAALAWLAWRFLPMRKAEVTFDKAGITIKETQNGTTRIAQQAIAWSEVYALLGTDGRAFFGIELHTNGPPPGRRIMLPIQNGPHVIRIARPYAKAAGYRIKPVFTKGFMSQEIWMLVKD